MHLALLNRHQQEAPKEKREYKYIPRTPHRTVCAKRKPTAGSKKFCSKEEVEEILNARYKMQPLTRKGRGPSYRVCASIFSLQRGPYTRIASMTELLAKLTKPIIVNNQPSPIPSIIGAVTRDPTQEKMFRMKLFRATPSEDFFGMNSVSIVTTILKMSMEPIPKKKFAII